MKGSYPGSNNSNDHTKGNVIPTVVGAGSSESANLSKQ